MAEDMAEKQRSSGIVAIILAAGRGVRFDGGNKLLAPYAGGTVLSTVITAVLASHVQEAVLVTSNAEILSKIEPRNRLRQVCPDNAHLGISQSLKAGLSALPANTTGAMIVLGDMPLVTTELIGALAAHFTANGGTKIVYPEDAKGQQGHPVIWPRSFFPELLRLSGDSGAKSLITANAHRTAALAVKTPGAFIDVDTRADYERILTNRDW